MTGSEGTARPLDPARSRRAAHPRRAARQRSQSGFSLIEILICVVLVGTVILALAAGLLTLVKTSNATSQRQQIQLALGSMTESLKVGPYLPCQTLPANEAGAVAAYEAAYASWPQRWSPSKSGMTARITGIQYWNSATEQFEDTCPPPAGSGVRDQGTQRLDVEVDWRGRQGTAQVVISYRPPLPTP